MGTSQALVKSDFLFKGNVKSSEGIKQVSDMIKYVFIGLFC